MQVQPLVPFRKVCIPPLESTVTIVALDEIDAGAADCALAIGLPPLAEAALNAAQAAMIVAD
jgi:hypothetical protein